MIDFKKLFGNRIGNALLRMGIRDVKGLKQYCVDTYNYGVNLPTEEEFKANKNKSFDVFFYFNGYHTLTPITGGFKFIMCKPYTD